jgi:hypothetical protein
MWRIIKFIFTGRWKLPEICKHHWRFVDVCTYNDISFSEKGVRSVMFVKTCDICGAHDSGYIYGCTAKTPDELNT